MHVRSPPAQRQPRQRERLAPRAKDHRRDECGQRPPQHVRVESVEPRPQSLQRRIDWMQQAHRRIAVVGHQWHGQQHRGHADAQRPRHAPRLPAIRGGRRRTGKRLGAGRDRRFIAQLRHCPDQRVRVRRQRVIDDVSALQQQVHRRLLNARQRRERALNGRDARRARHAAQREADIGRGGNGSGQFGFWFRFWCDWRRWSCCSFRLRIGLSALFRARLFRVRFVSRRDDGRDEFRHGHGCVMRHVCAPLRRARVGVRYARDGAQALDDAAFAVAAGHASDRK